MKYYNLIFVGLTSLRLLFGQFQYNHPELVWETVETEHFMVHFYSETENSANEGATVAEIIYPYVTQLYDFEPKDKTHLIFMDTDDIANGAAYYYDNKIVIWATPLDYELRGSHRWLQNVITHEFTHIVTLQKAMKVGQSVPGAYLQWMGYEDEKRPDVLYGYPNRLVSYAIPGVAVPPWLAEGTAQYMYEKATWDNWDTHRDMILRDRTIHGNLLSLREMNHFGKSGIGNESVYNAGYAFTRYIAVKYGPEKLKDILIELSRLTQFSVSSAIEKSLDLPTDSLYDQFKNTLEQRYDFLTKSVQTNPSKVKIIIDEGTSNFYPVWSYIGDQFAYISNKQNDYFGQTNLYVYDMESGKSTLVDKGIHSAPSWHPGGNKLYYSKRPKKTNKYGSAFYDLFVYDFKTEKDVRITIDARAFSPVYIPQDSSIIYIGNKGGSQNVLSLNLETGEIEQLTDFTDRRILHNLKYDQKTDRIIYDYTSNHFRNIGYISYQEDRQGNLLNNREWDERGYTSSANGDWVYSNDQSGIYNLYFSSQDGSKQGYLTNVIGGAFMPDINSDGEILYSLFEDGQYKIALIETIEFINSEDIGYSPFYYRKNRNLDNPITANIDFSNKEQYRDLFPPMFILPKIMVDYGSIKPGIYFYSSEILERLSLFGGASINRLKDFDLFFIFEFKRLFPTLFAEVFYLTRNTFELNNYSVYEISDNLRFRMIQFRGGFKFPFLGIHHLELYTSWQRYRAFIKESLVSEPGAEVGIAYDYYRGIYGGINWETKAIQPRFDGNINPSNGFAVKFDLSYEKNSFIDSLDLSDAGTLFEKFGDHNLWRTSLDFKYYWEIPHTNRWTIAYEGTGGGISNKEADSFFNFFGGGLTGIQGYPFYSLEGKNLFVNRFAFRIPLFRAKHIPFGWMTFQNSVFGFNWQWGDAWTKTMDIKHSVGIHWRVNGFSFYNYPTAIGFEYHRGLNKFNKTVNEEIFTYGKTNRFYFTLLFGF